MMLHTRALLQPRKSLLRLWTILSRAHFRASSLLPSYSLRTEIQSLLYFRPKLMFFTPSSRPFNFELLSRMTFEEPGK